MLDINHLKERPVAVFPSVTSPFDHIQRTLTTLMMFFVSIFLATTVWVIYRPASIRYTNLPFPIIEQKTYHPGEIVPIIVGRCSTDPSTNIYTITRGFNNVDTGDVIVLNSVKAAAKRGCSESVSYLHQIPKDLPPGTYTVIGSAEIQDVFGVKMADFESQSFKVK
jgi:hypothetical protein